MRVPREYKNDVVDYIAKINSLQVRPGLEAKVVINERTGTIVIGHNVKISTVSVAHGNLASYHQEQPGKFPSRLLSAEERLLCREETVLEVVEGKAV